jgi:sRNA-binding carbon storage regulator CsrA
MLNITRELGEGVKIGASILIRLVRIDSGKACGFTLENGEKSSAFNMDLYEEVNVGPEVTMQLQHIARGQIRLAFTAPRSVIINREELDREGQS